MGCFKQEMGFDGHARKYQYDEGGMLLTYSEGDQATLYERDSTGLLKRKLIERTSHGIVETRYAHDMLGRLTSVQNSHSAVRLHYDALDNLIAEEQTADLPDGYCYRSVYRHTYDVLGNRRRQTEPSGRTTEYVYDADDQLKEVKRYRRAPAAGDTTPPEMHAKYGYDGFGRRLWKLVKDGKAKPKLTVFSWDANLLTSEELFEGEFHFWDTFAYPQEPELELEDPSKKFSLPIAQRVHTLTARALKRTHWLYEPDSFVPAAQLVEYDQHAQRITGTHSVAYSSHVSAASATLEPQLYYIYTDYLGTPQELTDRDGHLQWVGHYRAWGELAKAHDSESNAANVEMPLHFQGQYCDAETGLHYNRFRYYDPQVGRFTTQYPISFAGGVNLYQYVPNPILWIDPWRLTGTYIFTDGVTSYRGKGPKNRMYTFMRQRIGGKDNATQFAHEDFGDNKTGFMVEHKLMKKYDAKGSEQFANSDRLNSPGKKLYENADENTKDKVDCLAKKLDEKFHGSRKR